MKYTDAERREFEIDKVLAGSLPHEGSDPVLVHAEDEELATLRTNHTTRWRVLTGPQTSCIVAVLELGPFHLAWEVSEEEEAGMCRKLQRGTAVPITVMSRTQGTLRLVAPPLPAELRPHLTIPYIPVSAA
jgi:hydrogenase maturation factor HypF (carbamoyltransferase family)